MSMKLYDDWANYGSNIGPAQQNKGTETQKKYDYPIGPLWPEGMKDQSLGEIIYNHPTVNANAAAGSANVPGTMDKTKASTGSTTYTVNAGNQPYVNQLNALYDQIMNRKPFQYDLNGDLFYRQMVDQATQLGQKASRDAMGQAAGLTGGYGNSYAQQVGNQAYQQQLTAMNQNIPDLYQQAMNAYLAQGDQMLQQYQLAAAHPGMVESIRPQTITTTQPSAGSGEGLQSWVQFVQNALTMNPSFDLAGYLKQVEEALKT